MAVINNREDFATRINTIVGDRTDDEALQFVQDAMETYDFHSGEHFTQADIDAAVNQREQEWREKYKQAFLNGPQEGPKKNPDARPDNPTSFSDLFK